MPRPEIGRIIKSCDSQTTFSPGIDTAFNGPFDRTASMGITGQFDHPDYLAARDSILSACQSHKVTPGIHIVPPVPAAG